MEVVITEGFLVLRRINWFENPPTGKPVPDRTPAIGHTHSEICSRYCGIEGWAWPDGNGLEKIMIHAGMAEYSQRRNVFEYFSKTQASWPCDLVYCQIMPSFTPSDPPSRDFRFCGYDFGVYISEFNSFSVVFNEVIYGEHQRLRHFGALLNSHLLLPQLSDVLALSTARKQSVQEGAQLEEYEPPEKLTAIAVYLPTGPTCTKPGASDT